MSSAKGKWRFRIQHILDAIASSRCFLGGMTEEQLAADKKTLNAIAWELMTIGEAARHVPADVEASYSEIPWPQMRGMRNHIVHGYDNIKVQIVWEVVTHDLPPVVPHLERILKEAVE